MNDEIRMTNDESNPSVEWQPRIRGSSERSEGYSSAVTDRRYRTGQIVQ